MTVVIPRGAWQSATEPVTGPPRKARFAQGVVHYEGHGGRVVTPDDIAAHLRQHQAAYLRVRGYSLGYGFAVVSDVDHHKDGTLWEIRGFDLNMASNPGRKWNDNGHSPAGNANDWTGSVLLIGPDRTPASPKAAKTVADLFATWHRNAGTAPLRPFPHSTLDYTACCGDAFRADIEQGRFDPAPATPPPVTVPHGAPEMFFVVVTNSPTSNVAETWLLCDGTQLSHVVDGHAVALIQRGDVGVVRAETALEVSGLIRSCKTMNDCPPEWGGTGWAATWNASR